MQHNWSGQGLKLCGVFKAGFQEGCVVAESQGKVSLSQAEEEWLTPAEETG